ncbi:hypothetical protein PAPYR_7774 [Paratrimastix pyriformis]|uniref:F-box domain-containing protein n=1 Tax=Paratrimastix pyriformis TaxID=342808 RepID=A0ABQ8UEP1_9EUKA|nr:hypothetical protein PAPYR_7774 [Paratrimastix pyriformis]
MMTTIVDSISRLPLDILLSVVELSDCHTTTYIQLLGLTHAVRAAVLGTARELAFAYRPDGGDFAWPPPPTVSLEALTALVRPCHRLLKLSLVDQNIPLLETGNEFECAAWVTQVFGGHHGLAALWVPMGPLALALMRGGHLRCLDELRLEPGDYPVLGRVLAALGRGACPQLRSLQIMGFQAGFSTDWTAALGPLAGSLRELILPEIWSPKRLEGIMASPLERVSLVAACGGGVRSLGPNLTHLTLHLEGDLTGLGLCPRLESLDVPIACRGLEDLLVANHPRPPLLRPALLDRLERLEILAAGIIILHSIYIVSSRLRRLRMEVSLYAPQLLCLLCPALEDVALPVAAYPTYYRLVADCPKLRCLRCPSLGSHEPSVIREWMTKVIQPLVFSGAARITDLAGVMFDPPEALCQLGSLRRLSLPLPKTAAGSRIVQRRLPPQLEQLSMTIFPLGEAPSVLDVDGPGLRTVTIRGACYARPATRVTLRCPHLVALRLAGDEFVAFDLPAPGGPAALTCLAVDHCRHMEEASLVACLT